MASYDVIVIGAGAMGSAAAYYLAKRGQKVLLLEQFEIDHQRGSSYGVSRIIRYAYDEPRYVELMKAAYPLWFELEEASGEQLYVKTGGVDFGLRDEPTLLGTINAVKAAGIQHEIMDAKDAQQRFPQFQFDSEMTVLYQADSGLLNPSLAVKTHIRLAEKHGAQVRASRQVMGITVHDDNVEVRLPNDTHSAGKLVVTAGAWAAEILKSTGLRLPLEIQRLQLMFWEPATSDPALFNAENMPVFIHHRLGDLHGVVYGIPSHHGSGVKAAFHQGEVVKHPDQVNYTPDDDKAEEMRTITREFMPAIGNGKLRSQRICLYTMTPDSHFIVDQHPQHSHLVIGAGFSGHGFKFSTMIGKILTDLTLDGATPHDISLFSLGRFA